MHIAVLVDDPESLGLLRLSLTNDPPAGGPTHCNVFVDTTALRSAPGEQNFDLLILDTFLSARRVLAFLTWLRGTCRSSMPVLVLGERSKTRDVAEALDAGANEYVITPFKPSELLARVFRFRNPCPAMRSNEGAATDSSSLHIQSSLVHVRPYFSLPFGRAWKGVV